MSQVWLTMYFNHFLYYSLSYGDIILSRHSMMVIEMMIPNDYIVHWRPQDYNFTTWLHAMGELLPNLHISMQTTTKSASRQRWLFLWVITGDLDTTVGRQIYDEQKRIHENSKLVHLTSTRNQNPICKVLRFNACKIIYITVINGDVKKINWHLKISIWYFEWLKWSINRCRLWR